MADQTAAKRARMACRIYLNLYDAGPEGAPVLKENAIGPRGDADADLDAAMAVLGRFVDDTVLDEPGHKDGVPHYALTAAMRDRMADPIGARRPLVDQVRADLAKADGGGDVPDGNWIEAEALIRTGQFQAAPL